MPPTNRHQNVVIANYYRQDFIWPGYTAQLSFHFNRDQPSFHFDENDFLVRPGPAGVFQPHEVNAYYIGWTGDGHINRVNISHAFYWVLGKDELNPIAGQYQHINAQMAAGTSFFWAFGDDNPADDDTEGFDTICESLNGAGDSVRKSESRNDWKNPAARALGSPIVDSAPRIASIPFSSAFKRRGCSTPRSTSSAPTIIRATSDPAAAPPAMSSTPTTATRHTPERNTPRPATWASAARRIRRSPRMNSVIRSNTNLSARSRPASASTGRRGRSCIGW